MTVVELVSELNVDKEVIVATILTGATSSTILQGTTESFIRLGDLFFPSHSIAVK